MAITLITQSLKQPRATVTSTVDILSHKQQEGHRKKGWTTREAKEADSGIDDGHPPRLNN